MLNNGGECFSDDDDDGDDSDSGDGSHCNAVIVVTKYIGKKYNSKIRPKTNGKHKV